MIVTTEVLVGYSWPTTAISFEIFVLPFSYGINSLLNSTGIGYLRDFCIEV
jgi:hypothetical protein